MKRKIYQAAFPATFLVVMAAFLAVIFLANANPSFASDKKKPSATTENSAVYHTESRIKQLHSALKITEDQEESWKNLTLVMRENAKEMDALIKENAEKIKTMNAVEHIKFHSQITEAQLSQQKKFIPPFEALYTSMSDEQKKITDTIFRTGKHGKHRIK